MSTITEIGAEIGRRLAAQRAGGGIARSAASELIRAVLDEHAGVKLPALLADAQTKAWMVETGITESQLRDALTKGRREQRSRRDEVEATSTVKLPTRRRTAASPIPSARINSGIQAVPNVEVAKNGIVQDRQISDL